MGNEFEKSNEDGIESQERRSLLTKDAKLLLLSVLLNSVPIGYMNVVPFVYLHEIGFDPSIIGVIYGASAVANTIALIPFGFLADRYGRKKFLIVGSFLPMLSYAIFGLTLNPYWLITASVIGGVGLAGGLAVAISSPALLPLIAASTSDQNRTKLFGVTQGVWMTALTLGALLSFLPALLISSFSQDIFTAHSISYYFMAALTVVSVFPLFFINEPRGIKKGYILEAGSPDALQRRTIISRIQRGVQRPRISSAREIAKFSAVYALAGLGLGVIVQLLPLWYNLKFGVSETEAGLWIALAEIASVLALPMIPKLVRRQGTLEASVGTAIVSTVFLALMPISGSFVVAASLFVIRNLFVTISWPILQSYMMGVIAEKERASAIGISTTAWGFANSIGTIAGGAILGAGLLSLPYVIGVSGYLGSAVLLFFLFRGIKPPEEKT